MHSTSWLAGLTDITDTKALKVEAHRRFCLASMCLANVEEFGPESEERSLRAEMRELHRIMK